MGTVCWRCEGTGPAGVALGRPANRVAWRSLKDTMLHKNGKNKQTKEKQRSGILDAAESWISTVLELLLQGRRHGIAPF